MTDWADVPLSAADLLSIGRDLLATIAGDGTEFQVRRDRIVNLAHAPVVSGLGQHCLRVGKVILDLHEAGKHPESLPLVRSVYESALTAMWTAQSREAVVAFFNEETRQRQQLAKTFARSRSKVFQDGADRIAGLDRETVATVAAPQARRIDMLCDALQPGGAHAYALYRALSAFTTLPPPSSTSTWWTTRTQTTRPNWFCGESRCRSGTQRIRSSS